MDKASVQTGYEFDIKLQRFWICFDVFHETLTMTTILMTSIDRNAPDRLQGKEKLEYANLQATPEQLNSAYQRYVFLHSSHIRTSVDHEVD